MSSATLLRPPLPARRLPIPGRSPAPPAAQPNWIRWFILLQFSFQLLQLTSVTTGPARTAIRIAAFGMSLLFLLLLRGTGARHPASQPALVVLLIVALSLFHPSTTVTAGVAQFVLYLAILAPLFWMPGLRLDVKAFRSILLMFWGFHSISAFFGILQVYYPGRFQPNISAIVSGRGASYLKGLTFTLANGQHVLRPMGLTDMPGGAGTAGFYAVLFGLGFLLFEKRWFYRLLFIGSMFLGMTCIYLSQVRANLVMLAFAVFALFVILMIRGSSAKVAGIATIIGSVVLVSFLWAVAVGGTKISQRVQSLTKEAPTKTYYSNRGSFLEYTVKELLPRYPLGAGLGRWGMTNAYFGEKQSMIWAEIQWTGWLLDGGVPLILAYVTAIAFAFKIALRLTLTRRSDLGLLAAIMVAYNLGALALTFGYPLFIGQLGLEFWMLNAALFSASMRDYSFFTPRAFRREPLRRRPQFRVPGMRPPNGFQRPGALDAGPLPR